MNHQRMRVIVVLLLCIALVIAYPFVVDGISNYLIYQHRFTSEMRVVASDGSVTFRPYKLHIEDKGHMVYAAFTSRALWPVRHISTADNDYLFGPFGRVVVLSKVGIHARTVTDTRYWSGEPHAFPFSDTPMSEKVFLRSYAGDAPHTLLAK